MDTAKLFLDDSELIGLVEQRINREIKEYLDKSFRTGRLTTIWVGVTRKKKAWKIDCGISCYKPTMTYSSPYINFAVTDSMVNDKTLNGKGRLYVDHTVRILIEELLRDATYWIDTREKL
jgi:hypothetical protein